MSVLPDLLVIAVFPEWGQEPDLVLAWLGPFAGGSTQKAVL